MSVAQLSLSFIAVMCCVAGCSENERLGAVRPAHPDAGEDASTTALRYWVGTVDDSDIRLAVAQEGDQARIFFCGGPSSYATATKWVMRTALAADGGFEFEQDDWQGSGEFSDDALAGKLKIGSDDSRDFSASPVRAGTIAGLYEGMADCGRLGLIVTQADEADEPSGQGACVGAGHPPEQVNPILPLARKGGEIRVEVAGMQSSVRAAAPP